LLKKRPSFHAKINLLKKRPSFRDILRQAAIYVAAFGAPRYNVERFRVIGYPTFLDNLEISDDAVNASKVLQPIGKVQRPILNYWQTLTPSGEVVPQG
jgi:hypothetical protein